MTPDTNVATPHTSSPLAAAALAMLVLLAVTTPLAGWLWSALEASPGSPAWLSWWLEALPRAYEEPKLVALAALPLALAPVVGVLVYRLRIVQRRLATHQKDRAEDLSKPIGNASDWRDDRSEKSKSASSTAPDTATQPRPIGQSDKNGDDTVAPDSTPSTSAGEESCSSKEALAPSSRMATDAPAASARAEIPADPTSEESLSVHDAPTRREPIRPGELLSNAPSDQDCPSADATRRAAEDSYPILQKLSGLRDQDPDATTRQAQHTFASQEDHDEE